MSALTAVQQAWRNFLPSCSDTGNLLQAEQDRIFAVLRDRARVVPAVLAKDDGEWSESLKEMGLDSQDRVVIKIGLRKLQDIKEEKKQPKDARSVLIAAIKTELSAPSSYSERPHKLPRYVNCHRGHNNESPPAIPSTLMSKILAKFSDDLSAVEGPSSDDCLAAIKLMNVASDLYKNEDQLTKAINEWGSEFNFGFERTSIAGGTTDGSIICKPSAALSYLVVNREDKWSKSNSEIQNAVYYSKFWATHSIKSVCPSILMTIDNATLTVGGGVMLETETLCERYLALCLEHIPFDYQHRCDVATFVWALKRAVARLFKYYNKFDKEPLDPTVDGYPYFRSFVGKNNEEKKVEYVSRIGNTLIFDALVESKTVIIKFARCYSIKAHKACTLAPNIIFDNYICGDWYVIVMEKLSGVTLHKWKNENKNAPGYAATLTSLREKVKTSLRALHKTKFVHGDIRPNNIIVSEDQSVHIIDFDWAGKIGKACYPLFMNHADVVWHATAKDGKLITVEHDSWMCNRL